MAAPESGPMVCVLQMHPDMLVFVTMAFTLEAIIEERREEIKPWESEDEDPIIQMARHALDQAVHHAE